MQAAKREDVLSRIVASIDIAENEVVEEDQKMLSQILDLTVKMIQEIVFPGLLAHDAQHTPCDKVDAMLLFDETFMKVYGDHIYNPDDKPNIGAIEARWLQQGPVWGRKVGANDAGEHCDVVCFRM